MIKFINENEFENEVKTEGLLIVDFFATWCMPCQMLGKVLEKISNKINILKINIDDAHDLAYKYEIEAVPTMLIFKDGKQIERVEGYYSEQEMEEKINEWLQN